MKNTLKILIAGALFGTALVGCGSAEEGNTPPTNDAAGKNTSTNMGTPSTDGTSATSTNNTPAGENKPTEGNTPAAGENKPAEGANTPAPDANATNK